MFKFYNSELKEIIDDTSFIRLFKIKWREIHDNTNVFRYKISNLQERWVDEKYILQLNPNRQSKRRFPEQINDICQTFDKNKFNFTKVSKEEIMFTFKESDADDFHAVLVNVSPISEYHSLFCPFINKCLPQVINKESVRLVINIMLHTQDRELRIGFNSLCAFASVNHLHYHFFIEKTRLPVENVKCKKLKGALHCFNENFSVPAFCFEVLENSQKLDEISTLLNYLIQKSIAHNVFVTRGEALEGNGEVIRFIVWPRKSSIGAKQLVAFNVAVCELSGWFPIYNSEDFHNLDGESLERELKKWMLPNFEDLCEELGLGLKNFIINKDITLSLM